MLAEKETNSRHSDFRQNPLNDEIAGQARNDEQKEPNKKETSLRGGTPKQSRKLQIKLFMDCFTSFAMTNKQLNKRRNPKSRKQSREIKKNKILTKNRRVDGI
jgi:hypothetical protein